MRDNVAFRNWLLACASTAIAVVVCIIYVDRPVAEFLDTHIRHTAIWIGLDHALRPLDLVVVVALLFLLGCGIWILSGRSLPTWTRTPLLCSWAAMWATAAEIIFKHIFGRASADPTYVQNHLYGFRFLHSDPQWQAFPSGTAAVSTAIVSVLCIVARRGYAIGVLIVVLLGVGVVITNYHWVADVIAGAFLGASVGWMTVHLQRSPG